MGLWPNALLALEPIGLRDKAEGLVRGPALQLAVIAANCSPSPSPAR